MKKTIGLILVACGLLSIISCNKEDITGKKLRIICENLPPYNYIENTVVKGLTVDIVKGIMNLMELKKMNIEITSDWQSALNLLETSDNVALFTTSLTVARKDKFQWVGPVTIFRDGFVALKSSDFTIKVITDARKLAAIGVVRGYAATEMLESNGFDNLVYFNTLNDASTALYEGTVPTVFNDINSIRMVVTTDGYDATQLTEKFVNNTSQGNIAFSQGVSPILVKAWQAKLDQLKREGFVQDVYEDYLPGVKAPGLLTVYSYENPTLNYRAADGTITGSSYDMVQALMEVMDKDEPINFTTFTDALDQVQLAPNSMNFSTLRTPEREHLFEWIGPVCKKNYCFYTPATSTVVIGTIEDAKQLSSIGVTAGWAAVQELINLGFTNLQTWPTPEQVFLELMNGALDAAVLNDISIRYMAEAAGYQFTDVRNALFLSSGESYLAFSLDCKQEYFEEWQQAYATILNNGTLEEIWNNWYPGIDW